MLSLSLTSSVPLKSTLSNSKASSKYKLRSTTYGYHPQSWIATFNISACTTCYTTANTLRYCSCRSSCSFDAVFIFVCNDISSSVCNSVLKSSATTVNCALNNSTGINAPASITRSTVGSSILSKSNTALYNKPHAIVGSLGLTATRRFILFWSRITGIVGGGLCSRQAATLATARECASERSVNMFDNKLVPMVPMRQQIPLCLLRSPIRPPVLLYGLYTFWQILEFLTHRLIQPILATEAPQLPQVHPHPQANGSQAVQSQEQAPPVPVPSPLPQQLQQFTTDAAPRSKSPLPAPQQTQQQPPMFPPGVKISQAEQQPAAGTSETPQSFAPPQSSSTSQQIPPVRPSLPSTFPGSLSDLVVSFESVKQKGKGFSLSLELG